MSELDFETMRRTMVESQLRPTGVSDPRVVAAMTTVPREQFVPAATRALAYMDRPVPLGGGRELNLSEATGRLLSAAQVRSFDRVLLIGAASGYTAALLASLGGQVVALEADAALVAMARPALAGTAVELVEGPLSNGWAAGAPYDLIFIDGLIDHLPDALIAQLAPDGRIACALRERGASRLAIGRKSGDGFGIDAFADCEAVPLPGFAKPKTFVF